MPPTLQIRFSGRPSIVEPFLFTIKLFTDQSPPSVTIKEEPNVGLAGKVTVKEPEVVSMIYCVADCRFAVDVSLVQPATMPVDPVGPVVP